MASIFIFPPRRPGGLAFANGEQVDGAWRATAPVCCEDISVCFTTAAVTAEPPTPPPPRLRPVAA